MRQLNFDLLRLLEDDRQGSHGSRRARRHVLAQAAETLHRLGYRGLRARGSRAGTSRRWSGNGVGRDFPRGRSRTAWRTCAGWRAGSASRASCGRTTPPTGLAPGARPEPRPAPAAEAGRRRLARLAASYNCPRYNRESDSLSWLTTEFASDMTFNGSSPVSTCIDCDDFADMAERHQAAAIGLAVSSAVAGVFGGGILGLIILTQQFPLTPWEAIPQCDFGPISAVGAPDRGDFESIFRLSGNC